MMPRWLLETQLGSLAGTSLQLFQLEGSKINSDEYSGKTGRPQSAPGSLPDLSYQE